MQLSPERLFEKLAHGPLAPTYFFHGEEPLQLMECADALRVRARAEGVDERLVFDADSGIEWQALAGELAALSLFASRRLLEIRLGSRKPDKQGAEVLPQLAARTAGDDIILVTADKLDGAARKSKWCKALEQDAVCVMTRELRADALPAWLDRRAARWGKRLSGSAAALVAERVEGNLLAAAQEVEKLCLVVAAEVIDEDEVRRAVQDSARYDVFQFADAVLAGDATRAIRILRGLREEGGEALLANWAVQRELRQLCALGHAIAAGASEDAAFERLRVWESRRALLRRARSRLRADDLAALLKYANELDTVIKGARRGEPWDELELLAINASGRRGFAALLVRR
jgi:DNA polymerase III subunit delta